MAEVAAVDRSAHVPERDDQTPGPAAGQPTGPTVRTRRVVAEVSVFIGAAILLGGEGRFQGPALASARALLPWWVWGVLWLAAGAGMCWGAWSKRTRNVWVPSLAAFMLLLFFTVLLVGSVAHTHPTPPHHGDPTFADPPAPSFIGVALFAWAAHVLMEIVLASPTPDRVGRILHRLTPSRFQ